jgi:colicin import membrane protein
MKPGLTISCVGHAAALVFGLVAISAQPMDVPATAAMPVDFISATDFSKMTQGVKNAPLLKIDDPKPLADKVDTPKPVDQLAPKVADKPAITTDAAKSNPAPKPDAKPADKPDKVKAAPDYKPDQIADLLKKDAAKTPPKPDDKATPQNSPKFDANQVAALLDHRDPQRQVAAAENFNDATTMGSSAGQAAQLSQSEIDALRARISSCWSPPPGVEATTKIYIVLRVLFKTDGSMAREPVVVEGSASALGPALAESAKRALLQCQPFTMLKPEHYDQWKDIELKFDPQELLGG